MKFCPAGMPAGGNGIFLRGRREANHQDAHTIVLIFDNEKNIVKQVLMFLVW